MAEFTKGTLEEGSDTPGVMPAFKEQPKEEELQEKLRYFGLKSKGTTTDFCAIPPPPHFIC